MYVQADCDIVEHCIASARLPLALAFIHDPFDELTWLFSVPLEVVCTRANILGGAELSVIVSEEGFRGLIKEESIDNTVLESGSCL